MTQPSQDPTSQPAGQPDAASADAQPGAATSGPPWTPPPGYPPHQPPPGYLPQQPGPGYPPPGYPPYPYQPPMNTYAILSLVLALAVFPPLGIYFGNKAKEQIARTGERGIELANVGVVVGWVFSALIGVFVLIWCGMMLTVFGGMMTTGM